MWASPPKSWSHPLRHLRTNPPPESQGQSQCRKTMGTALYGEDTLLELFNSEDYCYVK